MIICEKHEKVNITFSSWRKMKVSWKKCFLSCLGFIKKEGSSAFFEEKY